VKILEELVDYILNNIKPYPGNVEVAENTSYLVMLIKKFDKENNNGWIPVSNRLPNKKECNKFDDCMHSNYRKFLCTIKIADYEPITRELYYSKIFGWKYGPSDYNKYVIAWQPLPEPYKED